MRQKRAGRPSSSEHIIKDIKRRRVIGNRLQNIGGIEAKGFDVMLAYNSPEWRLGRFNATLNATFLRAYKERTADIDGTETVIDRTANHTDETFQRAFPKLRWVTTLDWIGDRWAATLSLRWTDGMSLDGGSRLDSVMCSGSDLI